MLLLCRNGILFSSINRCVGWVWCRCCSFSSRLFDCGLFLGMVSIFIFCVCVRFVICDVDMMVSCCVMLGWLVRWNDVLVMGWFCIKVSSLLVDLNWCEVLVVSIRVVVVCLVFKFGFWLGFVVLVWFDRCYRVFVLWVDCDSCWLVCFGYSWLWKRMGCCDLVVGW